MTWNVRGGDMRCNDLGTRFIEWGLLRGVHSLAFSRSNVEYVPTVSVLCPTNIETRNASWATNGLLPGTAGGIRVTQEYYLLPQTVSFSKLSIEEVPVPVYEAIDPTGYFIYHVSNATRTHTRDAGAGIWLGVDSDNCVGEGSHVDDAGFDGIMPRRMPDGTITTDTTYGWMGGGTLTWQIPFGWREYGASGWSSPLGTFAEESLQIFTISADGDCHIQKLDNNAERKIDGRIYFNGSEVF